MCFKKNDERHVNQEMCEEYDASRGDLMLYYM